MNRMTIESPNNKPNKSLPHAISHGPIRPPSPANVKRTPRIVLPFSVCVSETAAVMVGKMIDKKKPVTGKRKANSFGPNKPAMTQTNAPMLMIRIARK